MSEDFQIYLFGLIISSLLLTRWVYISYVTKIGLNYNPNKKKSYFGKPFYNIPNTIDIYLNKEQITNQQRKILIGLKYWEYINLFLLFLFPLIIIATIVF